MKIATWNVNGIGARLDGLLEWLRLAEPDLVCLQEIKTTDEGFPRAAVEAAGFHVETHGQKGFNGVALLSRLPFSDVERGLPGDDSDAQARLIAATVTPEAGRPVRLVGCYMPNGNPIGTEKFAYKLAWLARLEHYVAERFDREEALVLAGDFNIIPEPVDAARPDAWTGDALFQNESRQVQRRLAMLGLTDAIRAVSAAPVYTFYDYQAGAWPKRNGIRIDHLLLSPEAADRLGSAGVDAHVRGWEKPSDHVPVWVRLAA